MEKNELRKIVQCVRTLLQSEGVKVSAQRVHKAFGCSGLSDPLLLKEYVKNMPEAAAAKGGISERRKKLGDFICLNWDSIRTNEVVRAALLDAYAKGRIPKDKRKELQDALVKECEEKLDDMPNTI
jgi:hypothetical protein